MWGLPNRPLGGVYLCQDFEGCFGKMDAISEFAVSAENCGKIFFSLVSWACNFWMVGVIRDTFLANAFVNTSLVSLSLSLEWYKAFRVVQGARRG